MKTCILAGGIGAAKYLEGIVKVVDHNDLSVIVNVGDDSEMHGLYICPDLDIITYTLVGLIDPVKRWGIKDDTFACLQMLKTYDDEHSWFNLGDKDLATHIFRTRKIGEGHDLTRVTRIITKSLGLDFPILPCTNDLLRTRIKSGDTILEFEEYFVKNRAQPVADEIIFEGASSARATKDVMDLLDSADAIIIAPSNPYLSIDPILSIKEIRDKLAASKEKVAFISPIVGGEAIKGPTAKIMVEMGLKPSCVEVARHYKELSSVAVIDLVDKGRKQEVKSLGFKVHCFDTIMDSMEKKTALARFTFNLFSK
ncbi:MAG: 2-phospho-L-lactate transferase [Candidatus Hodarchaeota archaeon]